MRGGPSHEGIGEVVASAPGVTAVSVGDRVVVPFTTYAPVTPDSGLVR